MPLWLLSIAFSVFVFYTDDYMIAGVLPEIANDLHVSESTAGQLVSVYSLMLVIGAPLIAFASAHRSRMLVFSCASGVFIGANLLSALVDSFWPLLILRLLAGAAAATCVPSMFALVSALAPPERRSAYIGLVSAGIVGALALGVPLGTLGASIFGWRGNFLFLAGLSALALLMLFGCRRSLSVDAEPVSARESLASLSSRPVLTILLGNTVLVGGSLMMFTYFGVFAAAFADSTLRERGLLFAIAGVAGLVGSVVGGVYVDKKGPAPALRVGFGLFLLTMIVFSILYPFAPVPQLVLVPLTITWSLSIYWNVPAVQTMLLNLAPGAETQVVALNSSSTYLGVTLGSIAGGAVLSLFGPFSMPISAAILGALAYLVIAFAAPRAALAREEERSPS